MSYNQPPQYNMYNNQQSQLFDDTSAAGNQYGCQEQSNFGNQQHKGGSGSGGGNNEYGSFGYQQGIPGAQFMQDPMVANVAMQYSQNLVGQGKQYMDDKIEKIVSVSKVKYYFAVDTKYVLKKLKLLFFPFLHSDWSVRYSSENDEPVQPRYDVNAPDLYIPVMAYVTYILMTGFCLGLQDRFSPDVLGIQASWAILWLLLELFVIVVSFHVMALRSKMQTLHVLALTAYKYVGMIFILLGGIFVNSLGYYCALLYCSLTIVTFLFRTLRCQLQGGEDSMHGYTAGTKRRLYLMALMAGIQPIMMWWLTRNLIGGPPATLPPLP